MNVNMPMISSMPVLTAPTLVLAPMLATAAPTTTSNWGSRLAGGPLPAWVGPGLACAGILLGLVIIVMQIRSDRARRAGGREGRPAAAFESAGAVQRPAVAAPAATMSAVDTTALREVMRDAEDLMDQLAGRAEAQADRLEKLIALAGEAHGQLATVERRLTDALKQAGEAEQLAATRAKAASSAAAAVEAKPRPRDGLEDSHRGVYELADQGLAAAQIAKRLDRPTGEVELILSLRRV